MKEKSEAIIYFKKLNTLVEKECENSVKAFRADG